MWSFILCGINTAGQNIVHGLTTGGDGGDDGTFDGVVDDGTGADLCRWCLLRNLRGGFRAPVAELQTPGTGRKNGGGMKKPIKIVTYVAALVVTALWLVASAVSNVFRGFPKDSREEG